MSDGFPALPIVRPRVLPRYGNPVVMEVVGRRMVDLLHAGGPIRALAELEELLKLS